MDRHRLVIIFGAAVAALALLEGRLFWLQVVCADEYRSIVRQPRHLELVRPVRGRILDRNGVILAGNRRSFDLEVVLEEFESDPKGVERLAAVTGRPVEVVRKKVAHIYWRIGILQRQRPEREYQAILRRERRTPYLLLRDIPFEAAYEIEVHGERYAGLIVRPQVQREYPQGPLGAAVVGYVGKVPDEEHERWRGDPRAFPELGEVIGQDGVELLWRRGAFQDFVVGRAGLEAGLEQRLRGSCGVRLRSGRGAGAVEVALVEPRGAEDVRLTIDARMQAAAERALEGWRGAIVLMEVRDGGILAMASSPGFDPNRFVPPVRAEEVAPYLAADSGAPLVNRAVAGFYPPGSTFKVVTAAAAVAQGVVDPKEQIVCRGRYSERWGHLRCWIYVRQGGWHGGLALAEALERSCNVYFSHAAVRTGAPQVTMMAYRMGFGRRWGLPLPEQRAGEIPMNAAMDEIATASYGIGQGPVTAAPLEVAAMMAGIARGGKGVRPRLVADDPVVEEDWGLAPQQAETIREGLRLVVHGEQGTARDVLLRAARVAGKTGTAQVGGNREPHAWFAGYFPHDAPRYALVVILEHGGSGGQVAAPLVAQLVREVLEL